MLYLIGIGLNDEKDVSLKGLEAIRASDKVYLENYTSSLSCKMSDLEDLYGKKIIPVERAFVESGEQILKESKECNVSLLIIGDVFSATTHTSLFQDAKENGVEVCVIHGSSVFTAIGVTGLSLYKFGKTTSISWHDSDVPMQVINNNKELHTLCLLDLTPKDNKFMQSSYAIQRLIEKGFEKDRMVVVCAKLGSSDSIIQYLMAKDVKDINLFPQCIIIPGDLHFMEEELLEVYKCQ